MSARTLAIALLFMVALVPFQVGAPPGDSDANGTFDTAVQLGASGYINDALNETNDVSDFYKLYAEAGAIINVSIYLQNWDAADPAKVNFDIYLYNPNRQLISYSNSTNRYDALAALVVMSGTHYIAVNQTGGSGAYMLDYAVGQARTVTDGMSIRGFISMGSNHNTDWYRVELKGDSSPDEFIATLHEDATANFDLYFMDLWSNYSFWYDISWWSDPDEKVDASATYGGWYYLQVHAFLGLGNYTLNITVKAGTGDGDSTPAGAKDVPYNSSFLGHVDQAADHFDIYKMSLAQGESVTAVLRLDPMPSDMFALSILGPDLGSSPSDSKTNFVDSSPPALDRTISLMKTAPAAGTYYIVVMAKVALKPSIIDLSDGNAKSDYTLNVTLSAHSPAPTNRPPAAKLPGVDRELNRNAELALPMGTLFTDPDGDLLHYTAPSVAHITISFRTDTATITPETNWYGNVNFTLTATDPYNATASAWVNLTVKRSPLPPAIEARQPVEANLTASNSTGISFSITATDPDGLPLVYGWAASGISLAATASSLSWKVPADSGVVVITASVSNGNLASTATWNVTCTPRTPLNVTVLSPWQNTEVNKGDSVTFYAVIPGLPPSEMPNYRFKWYLGSKELASVPQFSTTELPAGKNTVEVRVTKLNEPGVEARTTVIVNVKATGGGLQDYTLPVLGLAVLGIALVVSYVALSRVEQKRHGEEDGEAEERARRRSRRRRHGRKRRR